MLPHLCIHVVIIQACGMHLNCSIQLGDSNSCSRSVDANSAKRLHLLSQPWCDPHQCTVLQSLISLGLEDTHCNARSSAFYARIHSHARRSSLSPAELSFPDESEQAHAGTILYQAVLSMQLTSILAGPQCNRSASHSRYR